MKTDIYLSEGHLLLRVEGRFVLDDCDPLKKAVLAAMSPAVTDVYVDLSGTDFIDSAGLGTLVSIKMKSNQNKARMTLVSPSPAVEDVLLMSKLNEIFEISVGDQAGAQVNSLAKPENHLRTVSPSAEEVVSSSQSPDSLKIEEPQKRTKGPDASQMVEELCRNAVEALRRGNYEESIRLYSQALEMDGDYLPARNNLAIVYEKRPEWKQNAVEQWEEVLRLSEQMGDEKHKERAQKHLQALRG